MYRSEKRGREQSLLLIRQSYPTEEPQPVEPPPDYRYSQQDKIRFITSVIKNNQNGRGVSIETVISEAAKIGMNREQAISYIEHLKHYGSAYEPIDKMCILIM
jgi:DNA replicative helicase MCM subunit Mcm2 (Cdc46/Mcm family)